MGSELTPVLVGLLLERSWIHHRIRANRWRLTRCRCWHLCSSTSIELFRFRRQRVGIVSVMFGTMRNTPNDGLPADLDNGHYRSTQNITEPNAPSSSLTWETRIQCFVGCFLLSIISSFCAGYLLLLTKLNGFCIMSSIGAILSLSSTCFLMGPVGQCKKMFDESRWLASLFYVGFIALALIAG
nr:SFT2 domain containing protein [Haemonchus contortus]